MKTYTNFKKIFLVRVFWSKYIFRIKFKIPILDLMLLPKNSVPFEGLYSSSNEQQQHGLSRIQSKIFNSLPASGEFCRLLITFPSSLDPDQDRQNVGPDLDPNYLTL